MRYLSSKTMARDPDDSLLPVVDVYGLDERRDEEPWAVLRIVPSRLVKSDRVDHAIYARLEVGDLSLADLDHLALEVESARQQLIAVKEGK
jgi:hypothetical protein